MNLSTDLRCVFSDNRFQYTTQFLQVLPLQSDILIFNEVLFLYGVTYSLQHFRSIITVKWKQSLWVGNKYAMVINYSSVDCLKIKHI